MTIDEKKNNSRLLSALSEKKANTEMAVRDYMVNKKGLDNDKIGYNPNSGSVTYNGRDFLKPSSIRNNTSYATSSEMDRAYNDYRAQNSTVPLRQTLVDAGYVNDYIGYNNKDANVTYRGNNLISPGRIENGVSYVTPDEADKIKKQLSQNVVNAADYMSSIGHQNAVTWNNDNTVSVHGIKIPIQRIVSDGTNTVAQVSKSDIDRALAQYNRDKPTYERAYDRWDDYRPMINRALEEVMNPREFSYSLEDDVNYQAYRAAAERLGQRAFEDTLGRAATLSGGYTNSAALAAAAAAQNNYLSELSDNVPQFFNNAYNRYITDNQEARNRLASVLGAAGDMYGTEFNTALALQQLINSSNAANYDRRNTEWQKMLTTDEILYGKERDKIADEQWREQMDMAYEDAMWNRNMTLNQLLISALADMFGKKAIDSNTYYGGVLNLLGMQ